MQSANVIELQITPGPARSAGALAGAGSAQILELARFRESRRDRPARFPAPTDASLAAPEVWQALRENRMVVHYQPQYAVQTGRVVAAEALVRLVDAAGRLVYPDRFIELVERSELIVWLGRAVISRVCADLAASRAQGADIGRIAINVSARQLELDADLLDFIDLELDRHGLQHRDLEFELTERQSLATDCAGLARLRVLADRGSRIVLDDFGIGYSSVIYLTELPISAFKLDLTLVRRTSEDEASRQVVKALLALAGRLGIEVVAEGVEEAAQGEFLERAGCPYAQGFGFAKPMTMDALRSFLADRHGVSRNDRTA